MNGSPTQSADSQHPWVGLASFTEGDREFFAGRGDEIEQLLRLVRRDTLTLLYGVSGLGKTSLLQAGLFPALRNENYLPVPIRLDFLESAAPLAKQVFDAIGLAAAEARVDMPQLQPGETLWEYFHRVDSHFWSSHNELVTPLLAFDQFEEFFTLGRETADRNRRGSEFISELADLVENRPPAALRDDPARAREFNFKPAPLKVLLSMREDYLGDLDYVRSKFRALAQNRMRLRPMGERQAREVIALGSSFLANGAEDRIIKYVAGASANGEGSEITVAPALLSLVLRELNERRLKRGSTAKITPDLLDLEQEKILEDFYLQTLKDFPVGVRTFVEDKLLTASGHRNSCALDDALTRPDVTQPILNKLVDRRLLAYEDRHNTRRVEITHDVLLPVIKASRDIRLTNEARAEADRLRAREAKQRRKQRITTAVACALALLLIATVAGGYYAFFQEHKAYYRDLAKRNGFPVGIMRISESQASTLPVSFRFIHKGIMWHGLKPRWKPAFRVEAINGLFELTTDHWVFPYLWKGELESKGPEESNPGEKAEKLGLKTVCQWEFVSTREGEIIYERALDRTGRMVYGLIYSPPGSGSLSTRLARFVGPDGFPQLQRTSAAEYVEIHYDGTGWEDRVTYRDGKGLPAAGPDGAFGQSIQHDKSSGQTTCVLSLDAEGRRMKDNAGNCGMQVKYDKDGRDVEARSVGPDLNPMPLKNGYVTRKTQYDGSGRPRRITCYGINGDPVASNDGYHGRELEYDEHGNQTVETYLGTDEKPMSIDDGYATVRMTYDGHGKRTHEQYYGVNGEPALSKKNGYYGFKAEYDEHGNQTVITYLAKDGTPMSIDDGYATLIMAYDGHRNMIQAHYYGVNGEPVLFKRRGYHGFKAEYDEHGNQTVITYLGKNGNPILLDDGYATLRVAYEEHGKATLARYYGISGEPVLPKKKGYHGFKAEYDEHGNQTVFTYLGKDGKPAFFDDGFATMKLAYDARGNPIRQTFYGVNGEPVQHKDGYYGREAEYDEQGRKTVVTYLGLDGKPTTIADGYATFKSSYDARGNEIRETFHGPNGVPVLSKEKGNHGWEKEAKYDKNGKSIFALTTFIGPTVIADGYAMVLAIYDQRGNVTGQTFYGVNGEPVQSRRDGCYGWKANYDEHNNPTVITYLDPDEKPMAGADGYAIFKMSYDERGNKTRETYYDSNDEPVLSKKEVHHGWEAEYDEQGNQTVITYLGLDGKPALLPDGYATMKSTYDEHGKRIRMRFYNIDGEPALSKENGYYGWAAEYDEQGNTTVSTYLGKDGKPMPGDDGYATVKFAYDSRGHVTRGTYHAANGEAVKSKKNGYYGWEAKYDEQGNKTVTYFGKDGKPIAAKQR